MNDLNRIKQTVDIVRLSSTFYVAVQVSIRSLIIPFILLVVVGYILVISDPVVNTSGISGEKLLGLHKSDGGFGGSMFGVPVTPFAVSLGLFLLFARFGFSLFQTAEIYCSCRNLIEKTNMEIEEREVVLSSLKDNFLVDAFAIFVVDQPKGNFIGLMAQRIVAFIVVFFAACVLLLAQTIVLWVFIQIGYALFYFFSATYFCFFGIFLFKIWNLTSKYPNLSEGINIPRLFISFTFIIILFFSVFISYSVFKYFSPFSENETLQKFPIAEMFTIQRRE